MLGIDCLLAGGGPVVRLAALLFVEPLQLAAGQLHGAAELVREELETGALLLEAVAEGLVGIGLETDAEEEFLPSLLQVHGDVVPPGVHQVHGEQPVQLVRVEPVERERAFEVNRRQRSGADFVVEAVLVDAERFQGRNDRGVAQLQESPAEVVDGQVRFLHFVMLKVVGGLIAVQISQKTGGLARLFRAFV